MWEWRKDLGIGDLDERMAFSKEVWDWKNALGVDAWEKRLV